MHRITSDPRAGKVTDTKHQCFGYRPPQSDPVAIRQAESARRLRRASAAPQQCSRNAASTSSAEDCPLAASLNLAEIRSMIDLLRVATVLVSHCVRKHTRTSATQTSLRQREARPTAPHRSNLSGNICSLLRRSGVVCADPGRPKTGSARWCVFVEQECIHRHQ